MLPVKTKYHNNVDHIPKHQDVFIFYLLLLKHIGEEARRTKRKKLYGIVSDHFYIKPSMVTRIINKMIKNRYTPHRCEIEEYKSKVGNLNDIVNVE